MEIKQNTKALQIAFWLFCLVFIGTVSSALAQPSAGNKRDTLIVRHLDFYDVFPLKRIRWPDDELIALLNMPLKNKDTGKEDIPYFYLPLIMLQLRDIYPDLLQNRDTLRGRQLVALYARWRHWPLKPLLRLPIRARLNRLRRDFEQLARNETTQAQMILTMTGQPRNGIPVTYCRDCIPRSSITMPFGRLERYAFADSVYIAAFDKMGNCLWARRIMEDYTGSLGEMNFAENGIATSSLGYEVLAYLGRKRLTIYLRADGSFKYYLFHW
jgi:hypothetical protein